MGELGAAEEELGGFLRTRVGESCGGLGVHRSELDDSGGAFFSWGQTLVTKRFTWPHIMITG